jgi:hypothetical protein
LRRACCIRAAVIDTAIVRSARSRCDQLIGESIVVIGTSMHAFAPLPNGTPSAAAAAARSTAMRIDES